MSKKKKLENEKHYKREINFKKALAKAEREGTLVTWYGTDYDYVILLKRIVK
jgi:hypothetical protein